jgi:hypothetical protein
MKRWWLPNQKGTELWPRTTVAPPKLVIEGVATGTELYRSVAAHYAIQLKQFHGKAQQDYSLSNNDVMRRHAEWIGARATYVNIKGQEIITLQVDRKVLEKVEKPGEDWWDWALIELRVPDTNHSPGVLGAYIKAQRIIPGAHEAGVKFEGYAFNEGKLDPDTAELIYTDGLDPFVLSWPPRADDPIQVISAVEGDTQIATLLVDLRRFPKCQCAIDIHAFLHATGPVTTEIFSYQRNPAPDHVTGPTITHLGAVSYPTGWPFAGSIVSKFQNHGFDVDYSDVAFAPLIAVVIGTPTGNNQVAAPAPSLVPVATGTAVWYDNDTYDGASGLLTGITEYTYNNNGDGPDLATIETVVNSWDITTNTGAVGHPADAATRNTDVRGIGGKGWLDWVVTQFDAPVLDFYEWDVRPQLPNHIRTAHMGYVDIGTNLDIVDENGDPQQERYRKIGTVTIDPKLKSISFKPE